MLESLFFVPVRGSENKIVELADDYCNLGNRVARVIHKGDGRTLVSVESKPQSMLIIALKVVSYILLLGIPWLIACAIKSLHRYNMKYVPFDLLKTKPATSNEAIHHIRPSLSHPMETLQQQLLAWWNEKDEAGDWKNRGEDSLVNSHLISTLQRLANQERLCTKQEIVLIHNVFGFFYGHMPKENRYFPFHRYLGCLLESAKRKNIELPWLNMDFTTRKLMIVYVKEISKSQIPKVEKSMNPEGYLGSLISLAQNDNRCEEFRILQVLVPYACSIKKAVGDECYNKLRSIIPAYPQNPHVSLS